tara:strand:+ start:12344 stop:12733 length:390 start_codon:yes stop_codon:yes gene_type:complete
MQSLPAVAKSFPTYCKKCDCERYHKVIAHKTAVSAKVQCEVCGRNSTFSVGAKRQKSLRTKKTKTLGNWQEIQEHLDKEKASEYSIRSKFDEKQTILHTKFGFGYVMKADPTKIEVVFQEGVKSLVHNR